MSDPKARHFLTAFDVVRGLAPGTRVRVTWPNGFQRTGIVQRVRIGAGEHLVSHDGVLVGGEYLTAIAVEVMGALGRYTPRWHARHP